MSDMNDSRRYNTYQDMDTIMNNRRYFLNSIADKYNLTDDDFIDIDRINDILKKIEDNTLLNTKETLTDFVNKFYKGIVEDPIPPYLDGLGGFKDIDLIKERKNWRKFIIEYTK